mmetsp:Transcript_15956/g.22207  ORF Transcript_15956/g.22207 Transcript_15956/m.22207 type:complete len:345 (-) Transcript_15956:53-1087(-)
MSGTTNYSGELWNVTSSAEDFCPIERSGHTACWSQINQLVIYGGYTGDERLDDVWSMKIEDSEITWKKFKPATVDENNKRSENHLNPKARAGHCMIPLPSKITNVDRYVVFGGYDSQRNILSDMNILNIAQDSFSWEPIKYTKIVPNLERRWFTGHNFPKSTDHQLLISFGWNDAGPLNDLLLFDLETCKWSTVKTEGNSPKSRRWHTSLTSSQRYYVYGGYDGSKSPLNDFHILDFETLQWSAVKNLPLEGRCRHTMNWIGDKQIAIIGGYGENSKVHSSIVVFHTDDHSWSKHEVKELFWTRRAGHTTTNRSSDEVVLFGGFNDQEKLSSQAFLLISDALRM